MRLLVTGGAGFLGSHLCDHLIAEGHEVICVDNFRTGSQRNVEHLRLHPGFTFVQHDVTVPYSFRVDGVFNLACAASPVHYQSDPVHTVLTCVLGSLHALELGSRLGIPVLHASTSEVYGDPEVHPQPETYRGSVNPIGIRACYDEGKRCAETLFFDFHRTRGTRVKVVRIFNTYGPRMSPGDGRVVSSFIAQALRDEPLTIYGDGSQTRSFCYVDDLIEGLVKMMASREETTGPVNLGNPSESTILQLARAVLGITGSRSRVEFLPLPADDPKQRRPEISLAAAELGWQPRVDIDTGLGRTIDWFRRELASS